MEKIKEELDKALSTAEKVVKDAVIELIKISEDLNTIKNRLEDC